jgi:site-specific recombinase XerD
MQRSAVDQEHWRTANANGVVSQAADIGRVFRTRNVRTAYENAVEAAKLDDVTFYTLRHTFASWATMRGVSLKELQELLGHSSLTMTMRYAHLAPDHLRSPSPASMV